MRDPHSASLNDSELRFSGEQGFFDKSPSIRLVIWLVLAVSLFLFLHFREVRVEILEVGSVAPRYVVAQVDFEFADREATIIRRQEAVRDVGRIFRIVEAEISQQRADFENMMLREESWRKRLGEVNLEEVYSLLEGIQKVLTNARFTGPQTLRKVKEAGMPLKGYQIFTPSSLDDELELPDTIWNRFLRELLKGQRAQDDTVRFVFNYFEKQGWQFEEDFPVEKELRSALQDKVPDRVTRVASGSRIIDQGEKVTPRHIAMMQAMKRVLSEKRNLANWMTLLGSAVLTLVITGICAAFVRINYPTIVTSNRKLCLLVTVIILSLGIAKGLEYFLLTSSSSLIEFLRYPLLVPFAAILTCNLMTAQLATFVAGLLTVIFTMTLAFDHVGFMIMNLVASLIVILSTRALKRRKDIFVICANAWVGCVLVIIAIHLYGNTVFGFPVLFDMASSALFMLLTAVTILGLLPLLESAFHIMSDVTLMEYMDPNHELLRRLSFEAPGTYQHTLMVCTLAEAGAVAVGANGLFCRVSSLYHDIGKMVTPHFFTENQQGELNVHQLLTPVESAQTIIAHVSEGVSMARKAGLPEQFIDIIKEHHGTSLVYFFYRKQLDQSGGEEAHVDEAQFRYAGPKPRTKESAIIMIADIFEAASRSLERVDEEVLTDLIDRLVRQKAEDGQFDECLLTFEELSVVKRVMVQTLIAGMHTRVKYPTMPEKT